MFMLDFRTPLNLNLLKKNQIKSIITTSANNAWASTFESVNNSDHEFSYTNDGGNNWIKRKLEGLNTAKLISFAPASFSRMYALFKDTIENKYKIINYLYSSDSWAYLTSINFDVNSKPVILHSFSISSTVCIGNPKDGYFEIFTSTAPTTSWTRVPQANIPAPLTDEIVLDNCFDAVTNTIWFATNKGRIFKSIDKGLNWTVVETQIDGIKKINFKDANNGLILAKNTSTILKTTTDGGSTWNDVAYQGPLFTTDISYIPSSTGTIISVSNDELNPGSSYSIDNGLNWFIIDDKMTYNCVAFYNTTIGYAGSYNLDEFYGGAFKWNWLTLGIDNNIKTIQNNLVVVPNPTNSICSIVVNQAPKNVELYSITGKYIYTEITYQNGELQIDLSNLDNGVYLINIINNQNERIVKKVIKQ